MSAELLADVEQRHGPGVAEVVARYLAADVVPHEIKIVECVECGARFEARNRTARFCSGACKQARYRGGRRRVGVDR